MFNIDYVPSGVLNIDYVPSGVFNIDYATSSGVFNTGYVLRFASTEFQVDLLGNHLQSDVSEFHEIILYTNTCSKVQGVKSGTSLVILEC